MRHHRSAMILVGALVGIGSASAQMLILGGPEIFIPGANSPWTIQAAGGGHVKFKYTGVVPLYPIFNGPPNFIIVSPSSGTTPAIVEIGLNPNVAAYMQPGLKYQLGVNFTTVDQSPVSSVGGLVTYTAPDEPAPFVTSVLNTASFQPSISPGSLVSIFGTFLAAPKLSATYDDTASFPTALGSTTVTFNGIASPLLYVSPNQINTVVPYALAGQKSVDIVVTHFVQSSKPFTLPLFDTWPGLFTSAQTGSGQAAILQSDPSGYSYNSPDNPASQGSVIELFGTGGGAWSPAVSGDITLDAKSFSGQPVSLTIGGQAAKILYAGTSPYQLWGLLQVNAVVPNGIGSGPQPVVLMIGQNDNVQQKSTMVIK